MSRRRRSGRLPATGRRGRQAAAHRDPDRWVADGNTDHRRDEPGGGALNGGEDERRGSRRHHDDKPGLLDEVAQRLGFRDRLRAHPALGPVYRAGVALIGVGVIALGVILLPLPGPGWLVVFLGLGILATEFVWAERLLDFAKAKVRAWTRWIGRQSLAVKGLVTLGTGCFLVGLVAAYLAWRGVPPWLPFLG